MSTGRYACLVVSHFTRTLAAMFDATVMLGVAVSATGGSFADPSANLMLWGSAAAAALAAAVVVAGAPATLGWVAIGYIVFAGLLVAATPHVLLLALALALVPLVPRPRGSLPLGLLVAVVGAVLARLALDSLA